MSTISAVIYDEASPEVLSAPNPNPEKFTTIRISRRTLDIIREIGKKSETNEEILNRVIKEWLNGRKELLSTKKIEANVKSES